MLLAFLQCFTQQVVKKAQALLFVGDQAAAVETRPVSVSAAAKNPVAQHIQPRRIKRGRITGHAQQLVGFAVEMFHEAGENLRLFAAEIPQASVFHRRP